MRMRRLLLTRFGIFTDHVIDFEEPVAGSPDLHIVYGPNESGKSTALAGFLDLLFAFEHRSPYSFAHGYDAMQVEADLQIGGDIRRFVRVRKRQGSLLDKRGTPVSDDVIANALGGMRRETYRAMFSLDDETLEAGGEEILNSEGDLGRLLFATGAGLVELSRTLNTLRDTAQDFHRARSRSTQLHELRNRLRGLEEEKKKLDTGASTYVRLVADVDGASAAYNDAMALRVTLQADREQARRRVEGLRRLADIRPLRSELDALESLPEAPEVWFTQIENLITEEPKLAERIEGFRNQERILIEERDALTLDDAILEIADRLGQLDMARARYVTAAEDLPRRRANLSEQQGTIAAIVRRLSTAAGIDPESLVIPAGTVGVLNELIDERSGTEERLKAAVKETETAKAAVGKAAEFLEQAGGIGDAHEHAFDQLRITIDEIQGDDSGARLALHTEQYTQGRAQLSAQMEQLHPWGHSAEDLKRVRVPEPEELEKWRSLLEKAERDIERIEQEKTGLIARRGYFTDLKDRPRSETGIVGDEEATRLRTLREEAWTCHRVALDAHSADSFEGQMREDDVATAGRIGHATALAELRKASEELRSTEADVERNGAELALARERRRRILDCVATAARVMCQTGVEELTPDVSLEKLRGWIDRRSEILDTLTRVDRENIDIQCARTDREQSRQRVASVMKGVGLSHDATDELQQLIVLARREVASDTTRRATLTAARQRLDESRAELAGRDRYARQAKDDDSRWYNAWTVALSECWLKQITPIPSAPAIRRILDELVKLESALQERSAMGERVRLMEGDQIAYANEVQCLVDALDENLDAEHPVAQGDNLNGRLVAAKASRTAHEKLSVKINDISEQISTAVRTLAEHHSVANQMREAFGVNNLRAVDEQLQKVSRRKEVRSELSHREARLVESMNAPTLEAAEQDLMDVDPEDLERTIVEMDARLEDVTGGTQELYHKVKSARENLHAIGGDSAVASLEEQRSTCLLEIQERAREYLRLKFGIQAAELALRAYRDKHRSSMMERASKSFRTISRDAYTRLDAQWTEKGEVLLGIAAGGNARIASQMSKGARFQLYLALRLAGYQEFVDLHGPVPFFADDILETFDDFRAEEAFQLFSQMANVGQVVYLSHHRHLCRIAQDVCPSVKIHELPGP